MTQSPSPRLPSPIAPRLRFRWLASGSKGNAGLLVANGRPWLFDCGISARRLVILLGECGFSPTDLAGIVLTHDHSDHISGLARFRQRCTAPVYASMGTISALRARQVEIESFIRLEDGKSGSFDGLTLTPFRLPHDAFEPLGFRVECRGATLALATDVGRMTPEILEHLDHCDLLCIESNHDLQLLQRCRYPDWLKARIRGYRGHLANSETRDALARLGQMPYSVLLAHVSEEANTPAQITSTLQPVLARTAWAIASQDEPSVWIETREAPPPALVHPGKHPRPRQPVLPFDEQTGPTECRL